MVASNRINIVSFSPFYDRSLHPILAIFSSTSNSYGTAFLETVLIAREYQVGRRSLLVACPLILDIWSCWPAFKATFLGSELLRWEYTPRVYQWVDVFVYRLAF